MATSSRPGLIAPDVGPGVRELGHFAELGDMTRRLPHLVRAGDPLQAVGRDQAKRHSPNRTGLPTSSIPRLKSNEHPQTVPPNRPTAVRIVREDEPGRPRGRMIAPARPAAWSVGFGLTADDTDQLPT